MQITSFTASRRVGFSLPESVRDAVNRMTDSCGYALHHPTLAEAIEEVEGVKYVAPDDMAEFAGPIFVDIASDAPADAEPRVLDALKAYAMAAISVASVAPELLEPEDVENWRWGFDILYVHDEFVLSSFDRGATINVHHLRNGIPCRATVEEDGLFGIIAELDQRKVEDWAHDKVPLLAKKTSGPDDDALMDGHGLERLVPVGRYGAGGRGIAYVDKDVVVVSDRSRRVTVHFRQNGRYALRIPPGEQAEDLLDLCRIRGLDPDDDANPVRDFVRTFAEFDVEVMETDLEHAALRQFAP